MRCVPFAVSLISVSLTLGMETSGGSGSRDPLSDQIRSLPFLGRALHPRFLRSCEFLHHGPDGLVVLPRKRNSFTVVPCGETRSKKTSRFEIVHSQASFSAGGIGLGSFSRSGAYTVALMPLMILPYSRFPVQYAVRYHAELPLLIAVLLMSVGPAYADWVFVDKDNHPEYVVYVDPDTIRRNGEVVELRALLDFETTQTVPSPPYLSVKAQREINCAEERIRLLAMTAFSGNMGSGEVVYRYSDSNDQGISVEPGSVAESLWNVVCDEK